MPAMWPAEPAGSSEVRAFHAARFAASSHDMSRPTPWLLPLLALLAAALVLAWFLPNRPVEAGPDLTDGMLESVSYAPYRPGQSPLTGKFPTAAQVDADLGLLARHVRGIRTYAANEGDYDIAALAHKHGLKLWQGIWLGADRAQNAREIARGIAEANRYRHTITRVVVGNEVLLRRDLPVGELIADIDAVRRAVRQQVTYADVWEFWRQFPEVAAHVDVVTIHLLPYWEDRPTGIDHALAHVEDTYRDMVALFPGKPVAIGETGWPSRGRWREDAAPSRVNQARFIRGFVALARREGIDYNLIEAFDQDWKYQNEGVVGANWGLWTAGRAEKFPLAGKLSENPEWPAGAAGGVVLGLGLLALGLCVRGVRPARQGALAVLAMALGGALGWAVAATLPVLYDVFAALAAAGNLAGQALLAGLLMRRVATVLAGGVPPPPRAAADATAALQGLLRLRWPRGAWLFDDLSFLFVWTACVLQLLLLFDPRYRDFPLPVFAVPLVAVAAQVLLGDLPRGGGRGEAWVGLVLVVAAVAGAVREGVSNTQSLVWCAAALVLAVPPLLRCDWIRLRRG
jgi:exo-beta-1,3-glucanase (GH17 family)